MSNKWIAAKMAFQVIGPVIAEVATSLGDDGKFDDEEIIATSAKIARALRMGAESYGLYAMHDENPPVSAAYVVQEFTHAGFTVGGQSLIHVVREILNRCDGNEIFIDDVKQAFKSIGLDVVAGDGAGK